MNLTISIDEQVLREARIRALRDHTSVNAVVAAVLKDYAAGNDPGDGDAIERILGLARKSRLNTQGQKIRREQLYEERVAGGKR